MEKTFNLNLRVEIPLDLLKDAVAELFPVVELSDSTLESLFVDKLQNRIYEKMPEDLEWRIKHDEYFKDLYDELKRRQEDTEEQIAREEINEWNRGYWKDVGAA